MPWSPSTDKKLKATDVFTPGKIPLKENNVLVTRQAAENDLELYFDSAQIPVVFGEYGVGKTTLVLGYYRTYPKDRQVALTVSNRTRISDIFSAALETIGYEVTVQSMVRDIHRNDLGVSAVLKGSVGEEYGSEKVTRLAVSSPSDSQLVKIMRDHELLIVIDELHKASKALKQDLTSFLKEVRNSDSQYPAVVLIGTTLSADDLTTADQGVGRYLKPVLVNPMNDNESRQIIVDGFSRLGLQISKAIEDKIVQIASGAPTLVQELCLMAAVTCIREGRSTVRDQDYETAVRQYLKDNDNRLTSSYLVSIEHQGTKRYRKNIIAAMSEISMDIVSLEDIRIKVSELLGEDVPSTALSGPLKTLKTGKNSILVDFKSDGTQASQILTRFREPVMKSFVRFMRAADDQGLAPKA